MKLFLAIGLAAILLSGCSTLSNVAVSLTSATATQATTVADATQIATIAEQAVDLYVVNGHPDAATVAELKILVPAVHNTLKAAQDANASGNSALAASGLAGFNQALAALYSYETLKGVAH